MTVDNNRCSIVIGC